ncbi:hypothetical protein [Nioella ostreopsis]|uniref:hypothetical protein n=1 Tax=Nioella ostreopsis TaxID=2448479 RepID=UPI000FDA1092|nr:hypothetical protein [Nioella ostreopsis]
MDIEQARREELMNALADDFWCFEEVNLRHATFNRHLVRADVVAVPKDTRLERFAIAFEVKEPDKSWHYAKWAQAARQAYDYVFARIEDSSSASVFAGRRISGAFLYPAPIYYPEGKGRSPNQYCRDDNEELTTGILHLGLHLRVGWAAWDFKPREPRFELRFGPNPVWRQRIGFQKQGINLLSGSRPLGSRRIDFASELDGFC